MSTEPPLPTCPHHGAARLVRILWDYTEPSADEDVDLAAGRVILGLSRRRLAACGSHVPGATRTRLPSLPEWACLACTPGWAEVHKLAAVELALVRAKWEALEAERFVQAAALRQAQQLVERAQAPRLQQLLAGLLRDDRPGLRLRSLMIATAAIALVLGLIMQGHRAGPSAQLSRRLAGLHAESERYFLDRVRWGTDHTPELRRYYSSSLEYHATMRRGYERAASLPWVSPPVDPGPPPPALEPPRPPALEPPRPISDAGWRGPRVQ